MPTSAPVTLRDPLVQRALIASRVLASLPAATPMSKLPTVRNASEATRYARSQGVTPTMPLVLPSSAPWVADLLAGWCAVVRASCGQAVMPVLPSELPIAVVRGWLTAATSFGFLEGWYPESTARSSFAPTLGAVIDADLDRLADAMPALFVGADLAAVQRAYARLAREYADRLAQRDAALALPALTSVRHAPMRLARAS